MKKAVIYGAGNIGRGFIGQLFSESGYELVFIDVNRSVVAQLNAERQYPIRILSQRQKHREVWVQNVGAVDGNDPEAVTAAICNADIMATAVGVNVLPLISKPLCRGLQERWRRGNLAPLNIIICENLIEADKYLAKLLLEQLDAGEKKLFAEKIGLVEASIGRMVPVMTPDMQEGNILRVCVEEYCELPVDRDGFKGAIPAIKNMVPESPFLFFIQRKLFIHNLGHAICAYCGNLKGYRYIWEAVADPVVRDVAAQAMRQSALALAREHGKPPETILLYIEELLYRFGNRALGDTVERVGRDPLRKVSGNDRFVGAIRLCEKHGLDVSFICLGLAAALRFEAQSDRAAGAMQQLLNENGLANFLTQKCELNPGDKAFQIILKLYPQLSEGRFDEIKKATEVG